jgi:hypothetical protein
MRIRAIVFILPLVVTLLQACARQQSRGLYGLFGKRDACSYIHGQQYPYDWEGSNVGACVKKLPPQAQTVMVPDPIGGLFQVPQTVFRDNIVSISTPVGQGVGEFNGNYVVGIISTSRGQAEFVCAGVAVTGSSRGICSLR